MLNISLIIDKQRSDVHTKLADFLIYKCATQVKKQMKNSIEEQPVSIVNAGNT